MDKAFPPPSAPSKPRSRESSAETNPTQPSTHNSPNSSTPNSPPKQSSLPNSPQNQPSPRPHPTHHPHHSPHPQTSSVPSAPPTNYVRLSPHSSSIRHLTRTQIPLNTKRATNTSLRVFARHVISRLDAPEQNLTPQNPALATASPADASAEPRAMDKVDDEEERNQRQLMRARIIVFSDDNGGHLLPGHSDWTHHQLKRVRHHLIQFVVNYKSPKLEAPVKPRTMMSYLRGLERGFWMEWHYKIKILEGPIFNCPREGLVVAVNNRFTQQEAEQLTPRTENSLSEPDLIKLFESPSLSRHRARSFQARLVVELVLVTALNPCALVQLRTSHFDKLKSAGLDAWRLRGPVGHRTDATRAGFEGFGQKAMEVIIPKKATLNGRLNIYQDIENYMSIRSSLDVGTDRFFLAINMRGNRFEEFFKRQHLGRNSFTRIIADVCKAEGIPDAKAKNLMAPHDLLGIKITQPRSQQPSRVNPNITIGTDDSSSEENQDLREVDGNCSQNGIIVDVANFLKRCSETLGEKSNSPSTKRRKLNLVNLPSNLPGEQRGERANMTTRDEEDVESQHISVSRLNATSGCSVTINLNIHYHR